jgi:hypothetical protein
MKSGLLLGILLFLWASCSITLGEDLLEERQENHLLRDGARLSVGNLNGDVTIMPWDGDQVSVTMSIFGSSSRGIPEGFSVETAYTESSLEYQVRYPSGVSNMSVKFMILVPQGLSLQTEVQTSNGNISVEGLHTVDLETANGNISVEGATGGAGAETVNGNINASFSSITDGLSLETVNGGISATIPGDAGFSAETVNGSVTARGFSPSASRRTSVQAEGEMTAVMETVNGNITVEAI